MGDRDVAGVPVTTLAGLTSLSDLLSELPISDPLSIQASLNKTLLFHPRVAEEANNLLAERDDSLVQQLVQAIEQTNSNHIELKDEYAEPSASTLRPDVPQLLQAIYGYRQNVFNNPTQQHQLQVQQQNLNQRYINQTQYHNQNQILPQQQHHHHQQPSVIQQQYNTQHEVSQLQQNYPPTVNFNQSLPQQTVLQHQQLQYQQMQQQQLLLQQNDINNFNVSKIGSNSQAVSATTSNTNWSGHSQPQQQQQVLIANPGLKNDVASPGLSLQMQEQQILSFSQNENMLPHQQSPSVITTPHQHYQSKPLEMQKQHTINHQFQEMPAILSSQQSVIQQQQIQVTQIDQNAVALQQQSKILSPHSQIHDNQAQKNPAVAAQNINSSVSIPPPPQQLGAQNQQMNNVLDRRQGGNHSAAIQQNSSTVQNKVVPRNNEYLEKQQQNKNFDIRGPSPAQATEDANQTPNHSTRSTRMTRNAATAATPQKNCVPDTQTQQSPKQFTAPIQQLQEHKSPPVALLPSHQQQTGGGDPLLLPTSNVPTIPDFKNIPVVDAAVSSAVVTKVKKPPARTSGPAFPPKENILPKLDVENFNWNTLVIKLDVIPKTDVALIQQNLDEFAEKSPAMAKKLGIIPDENAIFTKIKGENASKFTLGKRKAPAVIPETILSKPKLRKIEKKVVKAPAKLSKDEIMKSNMYQRFVSKMEQILEQLDDPDAAISLEDNYENIDCVPANMLKTISEEAAILKAKGNAIEILPQNKLTLLISYAMRSIHVAKDSSAGPDINEDMIADDCLEKLTNAVEAALLICNIYSCRSTSFLQEDNIDAIIKFVQFQLRETIFPSFDPVYTVDTKKKSKKQSKANQQQREIQRLYSKIVELTKVMVHLIGKFQFEDMIIIHASALGIEPFFVDNIDTLQFVCLDLVTTIFQNDKYIKHRANILNEILTSIDRLPHSKRNLRPYKLTNNAGNIQMITALVLQLIQCSVILPNTMMDDLNKISRSKKSHHQQQNNESSKKSSVDHDMFIREKYDTAVSIGGNFLSAFLNKCRTRSGDTDFRPIFENFIDDLLTTVNKPEWPAAELLLSLLGTLLVNSMSDKTVDAALRVVSLEYLGIVAARLRKDTVVSRCKVNTMDQLIKLIKIEQEKEGDNDDDNLTVEIDQEEERTEFLQRILLDFLAVNAQEENIVWSHSRHFYLTQWYRDIMQRKKKIAEGEKGYASRKKTQKKKKRRYKNESESSNDDDDDNSGGEDDNKKSSKNATGGVDQELNLEIFRILDKRKKYLLNKISPYSENSKVQDIKTYIDYSNAQLIAQYLASKRSFSQSFDKYLQKIILVVREQSIQIRTKAMKCLALIVEVDPSVLARKDMQMGVNQKFLDTSISVREAAVDLVGKYVLTSPELINQYYLMLSERILDTGVSVRKRVIKILRDICVEYPDFDKIPEICVKMIRRVNDEEGIQKLVTEVFLSMWFTPCKENDKIAINRKIYQIIDVVNSSHNTGMLWLDGLLKSIFQSKESKEDATVRKEPTKQVILSCQQIVDGLVQALMALEEGNLPQKLLGCATTLNLFAKIRPQLLVQHAYTLEPYLNIKCSSTQIARFIAVVAEILEQAVPLLEHPSETFLSDLESHLMMLIVMHNQTVVLTCIACLAAVVNNLTKNYSFIREIFSKYYKNLVLFKEKLQSDSAMPTINYNHLRRSIYIVGLFMRYFDFSDKAVYGVNCTVGVVFPATICDEVFQNLMTCLTCNNFDVRKEALKALGFFCVTNFEYLTKPELRDFYHNLLFLENVECEMKVIILRNIFNYLLEEDQKNLRNEMEWVKKSAAEDLKEMGDISSGMSSRIIQLYLKDVLTCFLQRESSVRLWAVKVVDVVLKQGLVHPVQIVPYLICLSTDQNKEIAHVADFHLQDIDKNHSGFINMKTYAGIHLSFELQSILQTSNADVKIIRGFRVNKDEQPTALNGFLYSLLRNTKPQRRALIQSITKQFDDQRTSLRQMIYLADNLAYFPYVVQDEPLYIIHQIDVLISVTGTNLLSNFREGLKPLPNNSTDNPEVPEQKPNPLDEDEEDDKDALYERLPEDTSDLENCVRAAQGCMLLLILKEHLKEFYGITDTKIIEYSSSETAKIYEKQLTRRSVAQFEPKAAMDAITEEEKVVDDDAEDNKRIDLVTRYLDFKQLMLKLDPEDPDDLNDDETGAKTSPVKEDGSLVNRADGTTTTIENDGNTNATGGEHVNNVNNTTPQKAPVIRKDFITQLKPTRKPQTKRSTPRKEKESSSVAKKKRRRKLSSTSEEEDYSDYDD